MSISVSALEGSSGKSSHVIPSAMFHGLCSTTIDMQTPADEDSHMSFFHSHTPSVLSKSLHLTNAPDEQNNGSGPSSNDNVNLLLQKDLSSTSHAVSSAPSQPNYLTAPLAGSDFDFSVLIPSDPTVLNALDGTYASPPASDDMMNLDFGFGKPNLQASSTLASDPAYMSFAEPSPPDSTPMNTTNPFDFSVLDQWSRSGPQSNTRDIMQTFDGFFGGNIDFLSSSSGIDFTKLMKSQPVVASRPVSHANLNGIGVSNLDSWSWSGPQPSSGDTIQTFDELFGGDGDFLPSSSNIDFAGLMKPRPVIASNPVSHINPSGNGSGVQKMSSLLTSQSTESPETLYNRCWEGHPGTKEQLSDTIRKGGLSTFVADHPENSASTQGETGPTPFLVKKTNKDAPLVMCRGSQFPWTEQSDKNLEILSAWRSITSNPRFKVGLF